MTAVPRTSALLLQEPRRSVDCELEVRTPSAFGGKTQGPVRPFPRDPTDGTDVGVFVVSEVA